MPRSVDWVTEERVIVSRAYGRLVCMLPVSSDFADTRESRSGGVDASAAEVDTAEQAIVRRFRSELAGERKALREWVLREKRVYGSLPSLAARLLGVSLGRDIRRDRAFKAELRKLEEYAQGKYRGARGERRNRIAALGGPGNPYTTADQLAIANLAETTAQLGVRGDWQISGDLQHYALKHTEEMESPSEVHMVLAGTGTGFCDTVADLFSEEIGQTAALVTVFGLHIQAVLP